MKKHSPSRTCSSYPQRRFRFLHKSNMKLQKVPVEKLKPAKYNPGKDLKPDDPAYEKIKYNMTTYGYIDPLI